MKGEFMADSMYWSATSASIEGAKGRHHSRNFTALFTLAFISGSRGSARIERAPSARGPNSPPPLKPAEDFSVGQHLCRGRRGICNACGAELVRVESFLDFFVGAFR